MSEADLVVLALPFPAGKEVAAGYREQLAGKTVVDICNPVDFATFDSLVAPPGTSAAEQIAAAAPGARVVKAFNTIFAGNLAVAQGGGAPLDVSSPATTRRQAGRDGSGRLRRDAAHRRRAAAARPRAGRHAVPAHDPAADPGEQLVQRDQDPRLRTAASHGRAGGVRQILVRGRELFPADKNAEHDAHRLGHRLQ